MQWTSHQIWAPRISAFAVALALGGSLMYWVLHWPVAASTAQASTAQAELPQADANRLSRLLGAQPGSPKEAAPPVASRFNLIGVVARSGGAGSAILSVDGKPAKSFAVGSSIEDGLVLKSVATRKATLASGENQTSFQILEMPASNAGK